MYQVASLIFHGTTNAVQDLALVLVSSDLDHYLDVVTSELRCHRSKWPILQTHYDADPTLLDRLSVIQIGKYFTEYEAYNTCNNVCAAHYERGVLIVNNSIHKKGIDVAVYDTESGEYKKTLKGVTEAAKYFNVAPSKIFSTTMSIYGDRYIAQQDKIIVSSVPWPFYNGETVIPVFFNDPFEALEPVDRDILDGKIKIKDLERVQPDEKRVLVTAFNNRPVYRFLSTPHQVERFLEIPGKILERQPIYAHKGMKLCAFSAY